ncbi:hypothetical protein ACA106_15630 [Agrobacterium pusense]|uniref:hypothetical protein n=1 Tax=Agrobacterium pusense TaxID=648995 RepID=UPI0035A6EE97
MPIFTDKLGREIDIEVVGDHAEARFNKEFIGDVRTTGPQEVDERMPPLPPEIIGWNVRPEFRRAGIATAMVRMLYEEFGPLSPAEVDVGQGNKNALTSEGYDLTVACQKLGYIFPFPQDRGFDDDDFGDDDFDE